MKLENRHFVLEIFPGDSIYFALKDELGNHFDAEFTLWEDLVSAIEAESTYNLLSLELVKAHRVFEIKKAGAHLSEDIIKSLAKGRSNGR